MITADVSSWFSAGGGGGIRAYYEAKARWLAALGVEPHFVVPGEHTGSERWGGGWLHRVAGPRLVGGYRAFGDVAALRRVLRTIGPDVVELASHYVLPQLIAPACPRAALVGFYHADFPTTYVAPAVARWPPAAGRAAVRAGWWWVRHQHRGYRATLAGSHGVAARLSAAGVPGVRWVGLGVDPALYAAPIERGRRGRIGYLGRLAADKELGLVLAAAPAIQAATGARVVIGGDGPAAGQVARAVRRGIVDAAGPVARAEVAGLLRGLDALIVPGRYETFSLVAAEALAVGTPVVAARQGGAGELVDRSGGGATFTPGCVPELVSAVTILLAERDTVRTAMRARGRRYIAEAHGWPQVMARIHAVHCEVSEPRREVGREVRCAGDAR